MNDKVADESEDIAERNAASAPRRKRRFLRMSLRTILLLTLLVCVALTWYIMPVYNRQFASDELKRQSAVVEFLPQEDFGAINQWIAKRVGPDAVKTAVTVKHKVKDAPLEQLKPLGWLPELETIEVNYVQKDDIASLSRNFKAKQIIVRHSKIFRSKSLKGLTQLERLQLSNCPLEEIDCVAKMNQLGILSIYKTRVTSLSPLTDLPRLKSLNLSHCQLDDFAPLATLSNLSFLNLSHTNIQSLDSIVKDGGCANLMDLNISNTLIKDLTPLDGLKSLRWINLKSAKLSDRQVETFRKQHPECDVVY